MNKRPERIVKEEKERTGKKLEKVVAIEKEKKMENRLKLQ